MDIRHLNYIIAIEETGSVTKAAEKLFISQSSLSYYLSTLEKELGITLFTRSKTGVTPTPAGRKYLSAARRVISIREELYRELKDSEQRSILIASGSLWGTKLFPDMITRFEELYPDIRIQISVKDRIDVEEEIRKGLLDFGLSTSPRERKTSMVKTIGKERFLLALNTFDPFADEIQGESISLRDICSRLTDRTFLISRPGSTNEKVLRAAFSAYGFMPRRIQEINGLNLTIDFVEQGAGVALIPESGIRQSSSVRYYPVYPELVRYRTLVHKPSSMLKVHEKQFFDFLKDYLQEQEMI